MQFSKFITKHFIFGTWRANFRFEMKNVIAKIILKEKKLEQRETLYLLGGIIYHTELVSWVIYCHKGVTVEVGRPVRELLQLSMLTTPSLSPYIIANFLYLSISAKCVKILHYEYALLHYYIFHCTSVDYCFIHFEGMLLNTYKFIVIFYQYVMFIFINVFI